MVHEVQVIEPDNARESQDHLATASAESESEATVSCPGSGSSAVSKFGSVTGSGMLQNNRIFLKIQRHVKSYLFARGKPICRFETGVPTVLFRVTQPKNQPLATSLLSFLQKDNYGR